MSVTILCRECGSILPDLPLCYGADAPWRELGVADGEFESRVDLTGDQCVVDEKQFFVRGHIDIPVIGSDDVFSWSVWCSLSEESFLRACDRWLKTDRVNDPPYFGWLMTSLPVYPETFHLKTSVQSREVGRVPLVTIEPTDHPLAVEQRNGMTRGRIQEIAHALLHGG
jgi:hypothetical protein